MRGLTRLARKAFQFSLILAVISRYLTFAWVTPFMHVLATVGHKVSNYRKYGILRAAEEVVRAGVLSYAPGSESVHMFHLSHFHRLVSFCWFGFGCWGGFVCFAVAFLLFTDQSVRSSYQPMTSLAYLHDCHSCYDERSIVQKKALMPSPQFSLTSRKLPNARWRLASDMPLFALHLNAVEAPDPKGASGREWCYVEPQAELSAFLAGCRPSMILGGRPAWRRRLGILWCVADLEHRIVRSTASFSLPARGWLP